MGKWVLFISLVSVGWISPLFAQSDGSPESEINLPMRIGLKPLYDWVEKAVDTVFTSEGYPDGWAQPQCDLRYRYRLRRGPLRLRASGQSLDLRFTGSYQIEGSTRVCVKGVVISPWTPPCRCGFREGERKVEMAFLNSLSIQPKYQLKLSIQPQRPSPSDACKVCLWEQNITEQVMDGMWTELVQARQSMEKQYGSIDLRPYIFTHWSKMSRPIPLGEYGWLMIRPLGFRVNRLVAAGDSIDLSVGLRARPIVVNTLPQAYMSQVPADWDTPSQSDGFNIRLAVDLRYDSLSRVLNQALMPIDIKPEKGPFRKNVRIESIQVSAEKTERVRCQLQIAGKYAGKLVLSGAPKWDSARGILSLTEIEYDLSTRHRVLGKAANWFDRPIRKWLEKKFQFDIAALLEDKRKWIEQRLNEAEIGPLNCQGRLDRLEWQGSQAYSEYLSVKIAMGGRMFCRADLSQISL